MDELIKCEFYIEGMHCAACELFIEKKLSKVSGIKKVDAKLNDGKVYIESEKELNIDDLNNLIVDGGYKITGDPSTQPRVTQDLKKDLFLGFLIAIIFFILFLLFQKSGIVDLASTNGQITLPFIFTIGVIASLSTCMAVVGGLVLSLSSNYAKEKQTRPMLIFHISRIFSFFILGGLIGLLGSAFVLTPTSSFILNLALFVVMIIIAINLLDIFSGAKKFQIRMPKFIGKRVIQIGETNNFVTPVLLGAATFFLPCGFTQSMQLYSLTTGGFINGAITMLVFALGTLPVLSLISFVSTRFSNGLKSSLFYKTAGFIIILFAIFNFTAALAAIGIIKPIFNI